MIRHYPHPIEINGLQPDSKAFRMGVCHVIVSPPCGELGWHMSISCNHREPVWEEIREAWYSLIPDSENRHGAMFFPPKSEYINVHEFCFHVHEVTKDSKKINPSEGK